MEAEQIGLQEAIHDLLAPWQDVEHISGWKRRMVEEGDTHIRFDFTNEVRRHP